MNIDHDNLMINQIDPLTESKLSSEQCENIIQSYKEIIDHWYSQGIILISKSQSGFIQSGKAQLETEYNICLNEICSTLNKLSSSLSNEFNIISSQTISNDEHISNHTEFLKQTIDSNIDEVFNTILHVSQLVSRFIKTAVSFGIIEFMFLEQDTKLAIDLKNESNLNDIMKKNQSLIKKALWIGKFSFSKLDSIAFEMLLDEVLYIIKSSNDKRLVSANFICQQINQLYIQRNGKQLKRVTFKRVCDNFNIDWRSKANQLGLRTLTLTKT